MRNTLKREAEWSEPSIWKIEFYIDLLRKRKKLIYRRPVNENYIDIETGLIYRPPDGPLAKENCIDEGVLFIRPETCDSFAELYTLFFSFTCPNTGA